MLKTRLLTALVLLAVLVPVLFLAPLGAFGALIAFVIVLAAGEWAKLLKLGRSATAFYALVVAAVLLASIEWLPLGAHSLLESAAIFWIVVGPFALRRKPVFAAGAWRAFMLLAGVVVFVACWHALVLARTFGVGFVLSLLLIVWLADIGAFFAGRRFGRRKLAAAISPGKSWEGAVGGWVLVMVVALAALALHPLWPTIVGAYRLRLGAVPALLALTFLVVFSVVGDLFESLLKRQAGVKDSGTLLPGHGGVLDRVDALLPVLPLAMLLLG